MGIGFVLAAILVSGWLIGLSINATVEHVIACRRSIGPLERRQRETRKRLARSGLLR